jgi:hypothetical protein
MRISHFRDCPPIEHGAQLCEAHGFLIERAIEEMQRMPDLLLQPKLVVEDAQEEDKLTFSSTYMGWTRQPATNHDKFGQQVKEPHLHEKPTCKVLKLEDRARKFVQQAPELTSRTEKVECAAP